MTVATWRQTQQGSRREERCGLDQRPLPFDEKEQRRRRPYAVWWDRAHGLGDTVAKPANSCKGKGPGPILASFDAKQIVRYETCLGTADRTLSRIVGERAGSARRIGGQHEMAIVGGRNGHRYESRLSVTKRRLQ